MKAPSFRSPTTAAAELLTKHLKLHRGMDVPWAHVGEVQRHDMPKVSLLCACRDVAELEPQGDRQSAMMKAVSVDLLRIEIKVLGRASPEGSVTCHAKPFWVGQCARCHLVYWAD